VSRALTGNIVRACYSLAPHCRKGDYNRTDQTVDNDEQNYETSELIDMKFSLVRGLYHPRDKLTSG